MESGVLPQAHASKFLEKFNTLYTVCGGGAEGEQETFNRKLIKQNCIKRTQYISSPSQKGALELITTVFTGGKVRFPGTETLIP